jgi:hypothetical protein
VGGLYSFRGFYVAGLLGFSFGFVRFLSRVRMIVNDPNKPTIMKMNGPYAPLYADTQPIRRVAHVPGAAGSEISQKPPSLAAPESGSYIYAGLYLPGNEEISKRR